MSIILAFAPFILFAIVDQIAGSVPGLAAGAVAAALLLLRDVAGQRQAPKILELGTLVLFAGLALYAVLARPDWSLATVRLLVDGGLLAIVLASLVLRRPFTLQYARAQVPQEFWNSPVFLHTNYAITGVWALAFAVMVAADLSFIYLSALPPQVGIAATVVAIIAAVKFTAWYPQRVRARAEQSPLGTA